jgi:hypothetical protein
MIATGIFSLMLLFPALGEAQTSASKPDDAAVREVVQHYLHGLRFNDVESLKKAFWSGTRLYFVGRNGGLDSLTQAQWYKGFASNAGKEEKGDLRIAAVEVINDVASVKVVEDYPGGSRYTDFLSLLKLQGRWWIVAKAYTMEKK